MKSFQAIYNLGLVWRASLVIPQTAVFQRLWIFNQFSIIGMVFVRVVRIALRRVWNQIAPPRIRTWVRTGNLYFLRADRASTCLGFPFSESNSILLLLLQLLLELLQHWLRQYLPPPLRCLEMMYVSLLSNFLGFGHKQKFRISGLWKLDSIKFPTKKIGFFASLGSLPQSPPKPFFFI